MPATGVFGDVAGGAVRAAAQQWLSLQGKLVTVVTDRVMPHGTDQHVAAFMVQGSQWMSIMGKAVCRTGDMASCGHALLGSQEWFNVDASISGPDEKAFAKHMICGLGKHFFIDPETKKHYLSLLQNRGRR